MERKKTVLILEDDLPSAMCLKKILEKSDYAVLNIVDRGEKAIEICQCYKPDVILADIVLAGKLTGGEVAVQISHFTPKCKVIFLTAYAEEDMIDYAIRARAFGYLMKPYRAKEILATIRLALFTNMEIDRQENTTIPLVNGFIFNSEEDRLYKDGKEIPLSNKKLKFIALLAKNKNTTVSNEQICNVLWGENKSVSTLRSLIHRIRITTGSNLIENINGVGYKLLH